MDYDKIINSVGSKEFWNKYSGVKIALISALENAETSTESVKVCEYCGKENQEGKGLYLCAKCLVNSTSQS